MRIEHPNPLVGRQPTFKAPNRRAPEDFMDIDVTLKVIFKDGQDLDIYIQGLIGDARKAFWNRWWHIKWNEVGELQIIVKMVYRCIGYIMAPVTYFKGDCHFMASWLVVHGDSGIAFQRQGLTNLGFRAGEGMFKFGVAPEQFESALESEIGFVALNLRTTWVFSSSGIDVGFGVGPATVGATLGTSEEAYYKDYPIKVMLFVADRKAKINLPEHLMSWTINFPHNVSEQNASSLADLQTSWAVPLKRDYATLVEAIKTGAVSIKLKGFASATAKKDVDDNVSLQRIVWAENWIRTTLDDRTSKTIRFAREPKGHSEAAQKGRSDLEQRVEIVIDRAEATKALGGAP